jgi:hypothetical protein
VIPPALTASWRNKRQGQHNSASRDRESCAGAHRAPCDIDLCDVERHQQPDVLAIGVPAWRNWQTRWIQVCVFGDFTGSLSIASHTHKTIDFIGRNEVFDFSFSINFGPPKYLQM